MRVQSGAWTESAAFDPDTPVIDQNPTAGPSSPPAARRGRQQDLEPAEDISDDPFLNAQPSRSYASASRPIPQNEEIDENEAFGYSGATDFQRLNRSYDDEDAALQAALRASMEDVPAGWVAPDLKPKKAEARKLPETPTTVPMTPPAAVPAQSQPAWRVADDASASKKVEEKAPEEEPEEVGSPVEELSPGMSSVYGVSCDSSSVDSFE
jgi:ataxin-3